MDQAELQCTAGKALTTELRSGWGSMSDVNFYVASLVRQLFLLHYICYMLVYCLNHYIMSNGATLLISMVSKGKDS